MPTRPPGASNVGDNSGDHSGEHVWGDPGGVCRPVPAVSAATTDTSVAAVGAALHAPATHIGDLLEQARAALGSLSSSGAAADGHAEIYAQVHRLLTEALRVTADV